MSSYAADISPAIIPEPFKFSTPIPSSRPNEMYVTHHYTIQKIAQESTYEILLHNTTFEWALARNKQVFCCKYLLGNRALLTFVVSAKLHIFLLVCNTRCVLYAFAFCIEVKPCCLCRSTFRWGNKGLPMISVTLYLDSPSSSISSACIELVALNWK